MPRESAFTKARRLLAEGRITIRRADDRTLTAEVRGDSAHVYHTGFEREWYCSCAHAAPSTKCSHVLALMLIYVVEDGAR